MSLEKGFSSPRLQKSFFSDLKSHFHHFSESSAAAVGIHVERHVVEAIAYRADAKSLFARASGIAVESGSLHLNTENAELSPIEIGICVIVENVGRENVTNAVINTHLLALISRGTNETEVSYRREIAIETELSGEV